MGMRRHRSAVGVGERDLAFPRLVELPQHVLVPFTPLANRSDLLGQVVNPRAARCALGRVALVEALKIVVELGVSGFDELGQRRPREIAILVVDRLDACPIHRQQLPAKQIELSTEQYKLTEHVAEGVAVVAPEVSNRLEVRFQVPQQPDHLDVAVSFGLQPAARSHAVQVAVDVKLQQIPRRICRAARHLRRNAAKPRCREIQPVNKGIDEPHWVVRTDIVVHCLRQKQQLRAVVTCDVRHAEFYRLRHHAGIRSLRLPTQSA